jgi:hypothetical protein
VTPPRPNRRRPFVMIMKSFWEQRTGAFMITEQATA